MLLPTALAAGEAKVYVLSDKMYLHQGCDYLLKLSDLIPSFMPQIKRLLTKNVIKPKFSLGFFKDQ